MGLFYFVQSPKGGQAPKGGQRVLSLDTSRVKPTELEANADISGDTSSGLSADAPHPILLSDLSKALSPLLSKVRSMTDAARTDLEDGFCDGMLSPERLVYHSTLLSGLRGELSETSCTLAKTLENDFGRAFALQLHFSIHEVTNRISTLVLLFEALKEKGRDPALRADLIATLHVEFSLIERFLHPEYFIRPLEVLFHGVSNGHIPSEMATEKISSDGITIEAIFSELCGVSRSYARNGTSVNLEIDPKLASRSIHEGSILVSCVFSELLRNAIDSMNEGSGSVTLRARNGSTNILFEVEDTGPGIPKDQINNIFKAGFTTKPHGTGQGLYLIRETVEEVLGGKLSVDSTPGKGTRFSVLLPYRALT